VPVGRNIGGPDLTEITKQADGRLLACQLFLGHHGRVATAPPAGSPLKTLGQVTQSQRLRVLSIKRLRIIWSRSATTRRPCNTRFSARSRRRCRLRNQHQGPVAELSHIASQAGVSCLQRTSEQHRLRLSGCGDGHGVRRDPRRSSCVYSWIARIGTLQSRDLRGSQQQDILARTVRQAAPGSLLLTARSRLHGRRAMGAVTEAGECHSD